MSRMIDLIKESAVPANVMRSAARGALSLPPSEMLEILVYLSGHHLFGEQARLSLAGFDREAIQQVASDPQTPQPVLEYLAAPQNVRPALLPLLLANPSLSQQGLLALAQSRSREIFAALLASGRMRADRVVLETLLANPELDSRSQEHVRGCIARLSGDAAAEPRNETAGSEAGSLIDEHVWKYLSEHADEVAADEAKGFELTDLSEDEKRELEAQEERAAKDARDLAAQAKEKEKEKEKEKPDKSRMSPLQRIAQMTVGERVQLGMKGSREDRYILIRDGSKVVSSAVLESPKVTDQEVETFAGMKNVQQSVLRGIAGKRKFMKLYPVMRALTANPRCPLDVALPIMKSLLVQDLRNLSMNKNVPDTLRKVARKMYLEKSNSKKADD